MDTQIGYEQLQYAVYTNQIPSGYAQNLIWADSLNKAYDTLFTFTILLIVGVDRYVFFRADTDTDYYRSSRPITDILNRYTCLV